MKQIRLPFIRIENFEPEFEALEIVPKEFALEHNIFPMETYSNVITIAVPVNEEDQLDTYKELKVLLEYTLGKKVLFFCAQKQHILDAINFKYDKPKEECNVK